MSNLRRILILGAGEAGRMAAAEMRAHPEYGAVAVGFLDDEAALHGSEIDGLRVLGGCADARAHADAAAADELLIAVPSAPGDVVRRLFRAAEAAVRPIKIVPGLREIILGDVRVEQIRPVRPEDLLGREHTQFDPAPGRDLVHGRRVMVTGAGGSIGADLCRQIHAFGADSLLLLGRGENSIFEIENDLKARGGTTRLTPIIADVRDGDGLDRVFARHRPDLVFHAAAHKHVHYMEAYPAEALAVNVVGTRNVAEAAQRHGVERLVMLSTDKAVHPTGAMGRSKRLAELVLQELGSEGGTRLGAVRFGNVLGSRGSVVPLFLRQIARGGPVTVSDAHATRYFMTIREASSLVLVACAVGHGGEVFVLDMGEPMVIADLARDLILLSGARPEDVPVVFTGLRPGEKLTEVLWEEDEGVQPTTHPGIRQLTAPVRLGGVRAAVEALAREAATLEAAEITARMGEIIDGCRG